MPAHGQEQALIGVRNRGGTLHDGSMRECGLGFAA